MKDKKLKKNIITMLIILVTILIFTLKMLPFNIASDLYNLIEEGYLNYANHWFAPAGRIIRNVCNVHL